TGNIAFRYQYQPGGFVVAVVSSSPTSSQTAPVTERAARQVAEAARESEWRLPSFAKELFLGRFRLKLVHPHPRSTDEQQRAGEAFLEKMREFCETAVDGNLI